MKNLLVILTFAATFAACKKENTPSARGGTFLPVDCTVNIKYVKDCSMQPVAQGTEILLGSKALKTDAQGNCTATFQQVITSSTFGTSMGFTIEGMGRGFGVGDWTTNESILFVQNDSLNVDVQFTYNANTAAQLKDSLAIGYDNILKPLPNLTRDSSFKMLVIARNRLYRKGRDGKYAPFQTLKLGVKGQFGYNYSTPPLVNPSAGPCGRDFVFIQ